MTEHRLALIIPTKDRPAALRRLLASIAQQTRGPAQVIVVDGGRAAPARSVVRGFPQLPMTYLTLHPPSLTAQKNAGIDALQPEISLVGFLDDDLVLDADACAAMLACWQEASPQLGGTGFTIAGEASQRHGVWLKRWFLLDAPQDGRVLRSGYNTSLCPRPEAYPTEWLAGGASLWRREVVDAFRFDTWFTGYGYLEDVDYSLRVHRRYQLLLVPEARVHHARCPFGMGQQMSFGMWQVRNRWHLATKHPELSRVACAWALVGQWLMNLTVGVARGGLGGVARALGNVMGVVRTMADWRPGQGQDVTQRTARRFGYLWAAESSEEMPAVYHYRRLKPWLPPHHVRGRVLDAGCGSGIDTVHLAQENGAHVVAVELSREGIVQTQARSRGLANVSLVQGDLEALAFRDDSFDFIYSYGVLHHVPHPERALGELVRVLKPGGLLALYVYEDFSTRSAIERAALACVSGVRRVTARLPRPLLYALCWLCAPLMFLCCALPARVLARWRVTQPVSERIPFRHGRSWFGLTGDLYDRFAAPIERRYSRDAVLRWLASHQLREVSVVAHRGWLAWGAKAKSLSSSHVRS